MHGTRSITLRTAILLLSGLIVLGLSCVGGTSPGVGFPSIISDSSGGAFVAYEVLGKDEVRDCYLQRISAQGESLWGKRGVPIARGYHSASTFKVIPDGDGGVIIAWNSYPLPVQTTGSGSASVRRVWVVTRVGSGGTILWQKPVGGAFGSVEGLGYFMGDGTGGAILASRDSNLQSFNLQRLDANGEQMWGESGITRTYAPYRVVADGSGGVVLVWQEANPADQANETHNVLAQRIGPDGNTLWPVVGILVLGGFRNVSLDDASGDGAGGVIITWIEGPGGAAPGTVWAQHLDSNGTTLWGEQGRAGLCGCRKSIARYGSGFFNPANGYDNRDERVGIGG